MSFYKINFCILFNSEAEIIRAYQILQEIATGWPKWIFVKKIYTLIIKEIGWFTKVQK